MSIQPKLQERFEQVMLLEDVVNLLFWDSSTVMPNGAGESRSRQLAALKRVILEQLQDPDLKDLLDAAETNVGSDPKDNANLKQMKRDWVYANAVDKKLAEAFTKVSSSTEGIWREAKEKNDFSIVQSNLEELVKLAKEISVARSEALNCQPYEALIDEYDPGRRMDEIDHAFDAYAEFFPDFIEKVLEKQANEKLIPLEGPYPVEKQKALANKLMTELGFDFSRGRLDDSSHPFCGGGINDVRITNRYNEKEFLSSMMGVIHETGHAMYELNRPKQWHYQPVGRSLGMTIHESQSLLTEMIMSRSLPFAKFSSPLIQKYLDVSGEAYSPENLFGHVTRVSRGFIRVEADEVTYPVHVIVRYRLEKELFAGNLSVSDLPQAWKDGMKNLLGVAPEKDQQGVLQDIHWYMGAFGYFPSYSLGAMTAAQIFQTMGEKMPDRDRHIENGNFAPIYAWLEEQVHGKGALYDSHTLVENVTGRPIDPETFKAYLQRKYLAA